MGDEVSVIGPRGGAISAGVTPPTYRVPPRQVGGDAWPVAMVRLESPRGRWSGVVVAADVVATSSHSFPDSEAAETVAAMADDKLLDRSRAAERERDAEVFAARQQARSERQRGLAAAIAVYAVSTFDVLDVVFLILAMATAYRVARPKPKTEAETE